jgi:hypothetical protein
MNVVSVSPKPTNQSMVVRTESWTRASQTMVRPAAGTATPAETLVIGSGCDLVLTAREVSNKVACTRSDVCDDNVVLIKLRLEVVEENSPVGMLIQAGRKTCPEADILGIGDSSFRDRSSSHECLLR